MRSISLFEIREALKYGDAHGYTLFPEIRTKDNIIKAQESPVTAHIIKDVIKDAEAIKQKPIIDLPFRRFIDFLQNGNRINYETLFFESKKELHTLVLAEVIERKDRFIEAIEERLWSWCNEYSWELPAHVPLTREDIAKAGVEADEDIALFAAETGFYFAEILSLLKDKLHPLLVYRIEKEIDRRIIDSYEKRTFRWEDWQMNWSSVCAGAIGCTAIYTVKDGPRLAKFLHRIIGSMDAYIEGFDKDGVTTEGLGYWQYGFSFYIYFAQLLKERTCGRVDLMYRDSKIKKIAELPRYLQFPNQETINFSDTPGDKWPGEYGILNYLTKTFEGESYIFPQENSISRDHTSKWALMVRNVFWSLDFVPSVSQSIKTGDYFFEESQWFISRTVDQKGRFCAFAVKGGHNDEPHNHNDLGHFILHCHGETIFCDLGAPEYVRDFFSKKRYEFLHASSKGHSVPVINNTYQIAGKEHRSYVVVEAAKHESAMMQLDLKEAYLSPQLDKYHRTFNWQAEGLVLNLIDTFKFTNEGNRVEEVFITHLDAAQVKPGQVKISGNQLDAYISFDPQATCEIIREKYRNHFSVEKEVDRIIIKYHVGLEKCIDICIKVVYRK
ncbi:heparinase II/III domain-containing protein [Cellulosilyticum sp. I15G10I2]|uniref:heparinase II/III domain-containing protein n=1 Tax=Cellulosilyticum sp. I15G10I2 TaxID=1892843 RepID=UPI00085C114E|nr:heparinase II/III family protein [Cellulosilyticum sp. I15G10I2]